MFRSRGGGGIGFYNNRGEEPNFSIFPESLGPKGSDWCSFQVDGPPQAILEPCRVRVTLIPGSTLVGQLCHRSCSLAYGFCAMLYTKSAISESSTALWRLNLKGQCHDIQGFFVLFLREKKMATAHASAADITP